MCCDIYVFLGGGGGGGIYFIIIIIKMASVFKLPDVNVGGGGGGGGDKINGSFFIYICSLYLWFYFITF